MTESPASTNPAVTIVVDDKTYEEFAALTATPLESTDKLEKLKRRPSPFTVQWPDF